MPAQKDPLCSIVGDETRVKMMRLFALNKEVLYTARNFIKTLRKQESTIRGILRNLEREGIVKKKKFSQKERRERGIRESVGYGFNKRYPHQAFLDEIVVKSMPSEKDILAKKIGRITGVRCIITTDMFAEAPSSSVDIIIASAEDNEQIVRELVRDAEREIGRELQYVFLSVNDLLHRMQTNDKFLRDMLDGGCQIHLDKLGLFKEGK